MSRRALSAPAAVLIVLACAFPVRGGDPADIADAIAAARKARLNLSDALDIAARFDPTARPILANMAMEDGRPVYHLLISSGRAFARMRVDAVEGRASAMTGEVSDRALIDAKRGGLGSGMPLPQAARIVGRRAGEDARIFSIELDTRGRRPVYRVHTLDKDIVESVALDAVNGAIAVTGKWTIHAAGWSFDGDKVDGLPDGWTAMETGADARPSRWLVVASDDAKSPPQVLRLAETVNTGSSYNLAVAGEPLFADLDLSVQVRAVSGKEDQGGGPVWRCKDQDNYYVCRVNPLEGNYRLYKVIRGKRQQIAGVNVPLEAGRWYHLRVTMTGDQIVCYLDGRKTMQIRDAALREPGKVGVWTKADAVSTFDDFTVFSMEPMKLKSHDDDGDGHDAEDDDGEHAGRDR